MLQCTARCLVVFTQAYPFLEQYARDHFLPRHPLASSNVWLDENDFDYAQHIAHTQNAPMTLMINPHAHNPLLSPYARKRDRDAFKKVASSAFRTSLRSRERSRKTSSSSAAAARTSYNYTPPICSVKLEKHMYLFNLDQMHKPELTASDDSVQGQEYGEDNDGVVMMHGGTFSNTASYSGYGAGIVGGNSAHAGQERYFFSDDGSTSGRRVSLPTRQSAAIDEGVQQLERQFPQLATDCMLSIQSRKPYALYLQPGLSRVRKEFGYQSRWWGTSRQWSRIAGAVPRHQEVDHMFCISIISKLVHISMIEDGEAVLRSSYISGKSGLLHMFLDESSGVEGVLGQGERGREWVGIDADSNRFQSRIRADMKLGGYKVPLYFSGSQIVRYGFELKPDNIGVDISKPQDLLPKSLELNGLPATCLVDLGSDVVRDPAVDVSDSQDSINSFSTTTATIGDHGEQHDLRVQHRTQLLQPTTVQYYYHISQLGFPASYQISADVIAAEAEHPTLALHGVTGRVLSFPELTYENVAGVVPEVAALLPTAPRAGGTQCNTKEKQRGSGAGESVRSRLEALLSMQSYGGGKSVALSAAPPQQEGASLPDCSSSCSSSSSSSCLPHAVADGSGEFLTKMEHTEHVELKELSAKLPLQGREMVEFVKARSSPLLHQGRSLWFFAEDVLKLDGIVDVNATPIGVNKRSENLPRLELSSVLKRRLYNVECLVNSDDAFRFVNGSITTPSSMMMDAAHIHKK